MNTFTDEIVRMLEEILAEAQGDFDRDIITTGIESILAKIMTGNWNEPTSTWRIDATIDRLITNVPAACNVLEEEGFVNLSRQLRCDYNNLMYWRRTPQL